MSGSGGRIATVFQLFETALNGVASEALIRSGVRLGLSQTAHGFRCRAAEGGAAGVAQSGLNQTRKSLSKLFSAGAQARLGFGDIAQRREESREDVGLDGLACFRLFDAVLEVLKKLKAVLVKNAREDVPEEGDGSIDNGHS